MKIYARKLKLINNSLDVIIITASDEIIGSPFWVMNVDNKIGIIRQFCLVFQCFKNGILLLDINLKL